jgi:hypothetical protein
MNPTIKLYRIQTENRSDLKDNALSIVSEAFDGFTIIETEGYWMGAKEYSLILEIVTDAPYALIANLAEKIRIANKQDAVAVTQISVDRFSLI